MELTPIIKESFSQYAGAVLQSRALVDARDCLKPSARQIFYCLYTDKFIHSKPFKKTLKCIGSAMRMYIHGDSSCEGVIMRAGQPFAMRYPLIEVEGSYGNLMESGNWAAPRYTSSRLSEISNYLFESITKNTIKEWRDNYDDTEQYPMVLPTRGFYNIVNGTMGIGIGMSSSLPQFNLKEVNQALIKLLWNENIEFDEIYCAPDFATGAYLLNEDEVKESLKDGFGKACKLRAKVEYDSTERCFIVTEIPYSVYTNTICRQLEEIINGENNPGIDRFNDLTGVKPLIKIYLSKNGNPSKVIKFLYKNTSLQWHYSINFMMLENGRYPRKFTWKQALQSYLAHEKEVYTKGYQFDLNKIKERLHIINGLLLAISKIDEVIQTIKQSESTEKANQNLQKLLNIDTIQAKAILDIKLSRLAKLEISKLEAEKSDLESTAKKIKEILNSEDLLKKEIEKGLVEVMNKFGDERRTKILNVEGEEEEPREVVSLQAYLTNQNMLYITKSSNLYTQKRGGAGKRIKMDKGEYIIDSIQLDSNQNIFFFSKNGDYYSASIDSISLEEKIPIESLISLKDNDIIKAISGKINKKYILFVTKKGMLKKTELSEYNSKRQGALKAISLEEGDEIADIIFSDSEDLGILTSKGNFVIITTKDVNAIGRVTKGIKAIKLNEEDFVKSARIIPKNTKSIVSITSQGFITQTELKEFLVRGKNTKGNKIQKIDEQDSLSDFIPTVKEKELLINSTNSNIKISINEIPLSHKGAKGVKSIKIKNNEKIIGISYI